MESLRAAAKILRLKNRHDLADLLSRASLEFEFIDYGSPIDNIDADIEIVDAAILAPYVECEQMRALPTQDASLLLDCLREICPYRGGLFGTVIRDLVFHIDPDSLDHGPEDIFGSLTGWPRVDRTMDDIRARLQEASTEEQFQVVGVLCREALISLALAVYDPEKHTAFGEDSIVPSNTDAKRMLDRYIEVEAGGGSNAAIRRCARAAVDLANELQHRRTATFRNAALCAEVTAGMINVIAVLDGRRDAEVMSGSPSDAVGMVAGEKE